MKKLFYIISCFIAFNYLSALEDEARALSLISEEDYEGGADE